MRLAPALLRVASMPSATTVPRPKKPASRDSSPGRYPRLSGEPSPIVMLSPNPM